MRGNKVWERRQGQGEFKIEIQDPGDLMSREDLVSREDLIILQERPDLEEKK